MKAPAFDRKGQQGAALVVGLVLLMVLTILAISGVFTATMELRMVRNAQDQERAFQAAEFAIEDALANPVLSTSATFTQAPLTIPNSGGYQYEYELQFVGQTPLGTGMTGFSIGSAFEAYHFQVEATGQSDPGPLPNARSDHTQSFYVVGPGT